MIYRLEVRKVGNDISWRWYWRKSFGFLSKWHTSIDIFDHTFCRVSFKDFDFLVFKIHSSIGLEYQQYVKLYDTVIRELNKGNTTVNIQLENK